MLNTAQTGKKKKTFYDIKLIIKIYFLLIVVLNTGGTPKTISSVFVGEMLYLL